MVNALIFSDETDDAHGLRGDRRGKDVIARDAAAVLSPAASDESSDQLLDQPTEIPAQPDREGNIADCFNVVRPTLNWQVWNPGGDLISQMVGSNRERC